MARDEGARVQRGGRGATADTLTSQAAAALLAVPTPRLAIIKTVDGDLQCPITDEAIAGFRSSIDSVLYSITESSPRTRIYLLLYGGHPAEQFAADLAAAEGDPAALAAMTGPPPCGILDAHHHVQAESARYLTEEVARFNAEIEQACARYPTCRTDEGHEDGLTLPADGLNPHNDHFSVKGLAAVATYYWPLMEDEITAGLG